MLHMITPFLRENPKSAKNNFEKSISISSDCLPALDSPALEAWLQIFHTTSTRSMAPDFHTTKVIMSDLQHCWIYHV